MKTGKLDHIALWVSDRDTLADFLTAHLGMHVIDRTDRFTLVGSDARHGKLTLFAADGEREPEPLRRVVLRVSDLEAALGELPAGLEVERTPAGEARFSGPQRVGLGLVESDGGGVEYDIDHVVLAVPDPDRAFGELAQLGFEAEDGVLRAGAGHLELESGGQERSERSLLNHVALLVESADEYIRAARSRGMEPEVVDAPNTYAAFISGPAGIKLEYVEHKPGFSLV